MDVSKLEGAELDAAVAKAEGLTPWADGWKNATGDYLSWFQPSTRWNEGGPIIEREHITITAYMEREYCGLQSELRQPWVANIQWDYPDNRSVRVWKAGPTPLIAAMRAYVASKVETVETCTMKHPPEASMPVLYYETRLGPGHTAPHGDIKRTMLKPPALSVPQCHMTPRSRR